MNTERPRRRGAVVRIARLFTAAVVLVLTPAASLLLVSADTARGRLCACLALLIGLAPLVVDVVWGNRSRAWRAVAVACGGAVAALAAAIWCLAPDGVAEADARVAHAFATGSAGFSRHAMGNLVPESDQLLMGLRLVPLVDRLVSADDASALRGWTKSIYRELEADPEFHALGSLLPDAYAAVTDAKWSPTHAYVYAPGSATNAGPRPVLVFFHGSGGNFKAYLWILSKLADRLGFVLVAPSGGFGTWPPRDTEACLTQALDAAGSRAEIDPARMHIMGLSNGGRAVSQLAARQGARFASVTFLSPVFDVPEVESAEFVVQCTGRRVLVVTGREDNRVPWDYVNQNVTLMKSAGARVTLRTFEEADHFLMFSDRDALLSVLEKWFRADE